MSEGLNALKRLINNKVFISFGRVSGKKQFAIDVNTIEKDLKALDVIKENGINVMSSGEEYYLAIGDNIIKKITKEYFDSLREVL